ncbi:MAG: M20 family metallopeptidase, partial [Thermoplasmata archaeon]|nr:M20 family metallopeptidase [Thermoplasmata archaeon]
LIALHDRAKQWKSVYRSPDWPDHGAPEPVITGRATLTKFDLEPGTPAPGGAFVLAAHAETDAANQIAQATTVVFGGDRAAMEAVVRGMEAEVRPPYRVAPPSGTALAVPPGSLAVQVVGVSSHGGYPHRGANPVPECLRLLSAAIAGGRLAPDHRGTASFSVDLRLLPEMELAAGRDDVLTALRTTLAHDLPTARAEAPLARARGGYHLSPDHPMARRLERLCAEVFDAPGVFGEYGGTDASSLAGLRTPSGEPLPALVFGSMDRDAHIHEAEESADPRAIANVVRLLERFVREA